MKYTDSEGCDWTYQYRVDPGEPKTRDYLGTSPSSEVWDIQDVDGNPPTAEWLRHYEPILCELALEAEPSADDVAWDRADDILQARKDGE